MPSQSTYKNTNFTTSKRLENTVIFHSASSGKEKDSETDYYYFGARYYNSDLSLWLSVDPMADKYPSLSPYNYCAWNPVKLVDSNGEEPDNWIVDITTGETSSKASAENRVTVIGNGVQNSYIFPDGNFSLNVEYMDGDMGSSCLIKAYGGTEYDNASLFLNYTTYQDGKSIKKPRTIDCMAVPDFNTYKAPRGYGAALTGTICGIIGMSFTIGGARDGRGKWSGFFSLNYATGVEAGLNLDFFSINPGKGVQSLSGENQVVSISAGPVSYSRNFLTKTNAFGIGCGLEYGYSVQVGKTWTF